MMMNDNEMMFHYDWAKTVAIDDDHVFLAGGSTGFTSTAAVFIINVKNGNVEIMPTMKAPR